MVLFLILSIPLMYLFALQYQPSPTDVAHRIRNPLVIGAASFFLYLLAGSFIWPIFSTEYRFADAFLLSAIGDQLLPIMVATVLFTVFFRKSFQLSEIEQYQMFFSFLAAFFAVLAVRDLTATIDDLGPIDLFFRPVGRLCWLVIVPWSLYQFRIDRQSWKKVVINFAIIHWLIAFASAEQHLNHPILAVILMLIPIFETVILTIRPKIFMAFFKRNAIA